LINYLAKIHLMRKLSYFVLLLSAFTLTGCIETLEEIFLNKDGSGEYRITFDMSEALSNPMMKAMIEGMAEEEGMAESGFDLGQTDTLISMANGKEGLLDKAVMHMVTSDSTGEFFINMTFPFEDVSDIEKFFEELSSEGGDATAAGPLGGGSGLFAPSGALSLKKRTLSRAAPESDNEMSSMLEGEEGEFMKMFLSSATHKTVYHFPGSIKKTTIEGATVDGKTVTVENSLLDMLEGKAKQEGDIVFKKN
jgi:hypothetical protein